MRRVVVFAFFGLGALIALAIVAFVLLADLYRVPSETMKPTFEIGDRFAALKAGTPEVGDIVVFTPPAGARRDIPQMCGGGVPPAGQMCARPAGGPLDVKFVQRIVAGGGDRIALRGGRLIRNGRPETRDGPQPCDDEPCQFPRAITVPDGHFFVLGDNRGASDDSRFWGPIRETWVVGRYWFGL